MKLYNAQFTNDAHDVHFILTNLEEGIRPLRFQLFGIAFEGNSFDNFRLSCKQDAPVAREMFHLVHYGAPQNNIYELQQYTITVKIPVAAQRCSDDDLITGILTARIRVETDEQDRMMETSLTLDGRCYTAVPNRSRFEDCLMDLHRQLAGQYRLRCCFTCQYSDYSPFGHDEFGTMNCFFDQRARYRTVHNKKQYLNLLDECAAPFVQETYLCGQFTPRNHNEGYRGFLE
ncbi:MAG: DUF6304 family protein [Oscillospiraceae bacterium]